MIDNAFEIIL